MCSIQFVPKTAIFFLYRIHKFVFIMETHCIFCEMQNEYIRDKFYIYCILFLGFKESNTI